jgi:hypothetical protein
LREAVGEYAGGVYVPGRGTYPALGPNTVLITAADFEDGRLPAICAVTGAPATANLTQRYSTTPGWVGCLFFINFFALIVAYLNTHQRVTGRLPVVASIAVRVERLHRNSVLLFLAGIACLLVAIVGAAVQGPAGEVIGAAGFALGALAVVVAIVLSVMEGSTLGIRGRVTKDGFGTRWVQLQGVHPAFVQAVANSRL